MNAPTATTEVKASPAWIFGITNLPFGVAGSYTGVAMPFLLSKAGVPTGTIAAMGGLAMLPAAYQLFWAPVLDLGIRRRAWLVLVSILGALCLGASMLLHLPEHLVAYEVLMVAGQLLVGLVSSCNGAMVSTGLPDHMRGRAAGWINAANLGAAALGGGAVMTLAGQVSVQAAAIGLMLMIILPSLAALTIAEPPPPRDPLLPHMALMARDVWRAVRARQGWTGLLFCISPVGTVALTNLFSALGKDYGASSHVIECVNGYAGGFVTAAAALMTGFMLDRVSRRGVYLLSGALTAVCAIAMAMAPMNRNTFIVGSLCYLVVAGVAYASFSAVVYEIVGTAGKTASTLYSVFPAAGNQAIAYMLFLHGAAYKWWGARGVLYCDAALNLAGIVALLILLRVVFPERPPMPLAKDTVQPVLSDDLVAELKLS